VELTEAIGIAAKILGTVKPYCKRAQIVGSVRREKPEVKDIEIVILDKGVNRARMYENLASYGRFIKPGTSEIVDWPPKEDARYLRMLLDEGIKLDIFFAHEDNWGGVVMLRTGSASSSTGCMYTGFGPSILALWKKKSGGGRFLNCMFQKPDGSVVPLREERDVFDILNIEWVDPRDRKDRSAIKPKK
jgi:DNA polymerase/3'-5' exonuclease PolX